MEDGYDEDDDVRRPLQYTTYVYSKYDYQPLIQNHQITEQERECLQRQIEQDQQDAQREMKEKCRRNKKLIQEEKRKKNEKISIHKALYQPLIHNNNRLSKYIYIIFGYMTRIF